MFTYPEILTLTKALQYIEWTGCASSILILYDHLISLSDEVACFWDNSWSLSKALYMIIRYGGLAQSIIKLLGTSGLENGWLDGFMLLQFVGAFLILITAQAVVGLRVWYLFQKNKAIQAFSVITYVGCAVATIILAKQQHPFISIEMSQSPELSRSPGSLWTIYVPSLVAHTTFFFLKIIRLVTASEPVHGTFLALIFKEGCVIYVFAVASLLYSIVSLTFTNASDVVEYMTALGSNMAVAATVLSVCRAMLHIRSLADTWHVKQSWLLNHAELSRVTGTMENQGREIYVEVDAR